MTAQMGERLFYEGDEHSMCSTPLSGYFALGGECPKFGQFCTALWRGYVGSWEIRHDRLYMVGLQGTLDDGTKANLETVFPGYPDRVFAHWYSGEIRIPQGRLLNYVHGGFASTYERDVFLKFEKGLLVAKRVKENGQAEDDSSPEGYSSGAWTVFPAPKKDGE